MLKILQKLFKKEQVSVQPAAIPARLTDELWDELVNKKEKPIQGDNEFYRQCSDIVNMPAFEVVIDAMIAEQMKAAIDNSTDNQHFRQYLSSVIGIRKVRERFRELSAAMKEQEEEFNKYEPI